MYVFRAEVSILEVFKMTSFSGFWFVYPGNKNGNNLSAMRSSRMLLQRPTQYPNTTIHIMI
jgi:hypothetical protein